MPPTPSSALPPGTRLRGGKYAVSTVLGQGGFAITYKGGDIALRRFVAIKEYFPHGATRHGQEVAMGLDVAGFQEGKQAFIHEAATLSRFQHPAIVRVLDAFPENNSAYMVLEFLDGQTLGQKLAGGKRLEEWEAISLGTLIAGALEVIHNAGMLHRDVKPDNIMLTNDGRTVLIDFGTARSYEGSAQSMTQVLTPGYAPLEQYAAVAKRGPQTDIYGLAATLYHALSGTRPTAATDRAADVPLSHLRELVPQLARNVTETIMMALAMDVNQRPPTAAQFAGMLQGRLAVGPPTTTPRTQTGGPPAPPRMPGNLPTQESEELGDVVLLHSKLQRHSLPVNALAFSTDGSRLASAGQDRMIYVWNAQSSGLMAHLSGHERGVSCVAFAPNGLLLSGGQDGSLRLWNVDARQSIGVVSDTTGPVNAVAFSPSRPLFACADEGGWSLRDANTAQILMHARGEARALAFSSNGALLTIGFANGQIALFDGNTGASLGAVPGHADDVLKLAFSPDGSMLATGGTDGFLRVWQVQTGTKLWEQQPSVLPSTGVCWSPDGRLLASASRDYLLLWTWQGSLWKRYSQHTDRITDLAFSPRVPAPYWYMMATAARDKTVNVCRVTGKVGA